MNVNEVIAGRANELPAIRVAASRRCIPTTTSTARRVPTTASPPPCTSPPPRPLHEQLLPAIAELSGGLAEQSARHASLVKTGRTHLMDATPITFGQELSAFVAQLDYAERAIPRGAAGGLPVGPGRHRGGHRATRRRASPTPSPRKSPPESGLPFVAAPNKFAALAGHEPLVILSGALKSLAVA